MALVLIADDDVLIREMLAEVVAEYGHTVITAANGVEALAQAGSQPPALIISDVMMPEMDGYALLRAVREDAALHQTLIVLMSAAFLSVGPPKIDPPPDGYVAKPFNLSVIEGLLEHLPLDESQ